MRPARASSRPRFAMTLLGALLALVTTAACASSRPSASKDVATPPEPASAAVSEAAPASALAMVPTAPPPAIPSGPRLPGPFNPPGGLPLVAAGEARTETEGCLALANPETEGPAKAPYVENTRGGGDGPEIALRPTPSSVVITHALHHNCCQKADVQTKVEGEKITVTETFTGNTCRCNCRSTLKTTVGLKPGTYTVEVIRVDNGPAKSIYSGSVSIQSLMAPKPR